MSKLKVQEIWHWGLGLDLAFELGALAFELYGKSRKALGPASLIKQGILP